MGRPRARCRKSRPEQVDHTDESWAGSGIVPGPAHRKDVMQTLATYVDALLNGNGAVSVVHSETQREQWEDQGFDVSREVTTSRFANGVVIRRAVEQDSFPSGLACAECWIEYTVLATGAAGTVEPACKRFDSTCREAYWLAWHRAP